LSPHHLTNSYTESRKHVTDAYTTTRFTDRIAFANPHAGIRRQPAYPQH
jgi:hypothetical protein